MEVIVRLIFSSVNLIDDLYDKGIFATATIQPNRAGLPQEIKDVKLNPGQIILENEGSSNSSDKMERYKRCYPY